LAAVYREKFALVFLDFDLMKDRYSGNRFTPETLKALREHYRLNEQIGTYHLYRPASASTSSTSDG
jgi:hypothetical protein